MKNETATDRGNQLFLKPTLLRISWGNAGHYSRYQARLGLERLRRTVGAENEPLKSSIFVRRRRASNPATGPERFPMECERAPHHES